MRIIFMGTPDFAVASLKALLDNGENVVAVVTSPDKPAGRGQKLSQSAVKQFAEANKIPVLQPDKLKNEVFIEELRTYNADLQIVVAFRMLPEVVWNMPPFGTINVHASLLPQYRGAAPINHAIINGEKITGVTTFLLKHEIDTGNILLAKEVPIEDTDNAGSLHDKLMKAGAETLIETIVALRSKKLVPVPQKNTSNKSLKHAPKIFKDDCLINWDDNNKSIFNKIRGLSPYPASFTIIDGKTLKLFEVDEDTNPNNIKVGKYITDNKTFLKFASKDGLINIKSLQLEGKRRMSIEDFLRGYHFEE